MYIYFGGNCSKYSDINDVRIQSVFKSADPDLRTTILSHNGLVEHIKRSCFQAGWVWKAAEQNVDVPYPAFYGWVKSSENAVKYIP